MARKSSRTASPAQPAPQPAADTSTLSPNMNNNSVHRKKSSTSLSTSSRLSVETHQSQQTTTGHSRNSSTGSVRSVSSSVGSGPAKSSNGGGSGSGTGAVDVVNNLATHYLRTTPQRMLLVDAFMGFLVVVGAVQFLYCVLAGTYPFNAFLSGFSATVGQFVLTASLRIQTTEVNKNDFPSVSPERAFADYIVGSLILHFFCVNFIN